MSEVSFRKMHWVPKFGAKNIKKGKLYPKKSLSPYFLFQQE